MNRETSIENWKNKKNNQININHFHEITNSKQTKHYGTIYFIVISVEKASIRFVSADMCFQYGKGPIRGPLWVWTR